MAQPIAELSSHVLASAIEMAKSHPKTSIFGALNIILTPIYGAGWLISLFLKLIGMNSLGPVAGGAAAWYQANYLGGYIPAGSIFSFFQWLAMKGFGM